MSRIDAAGMVATLAWASRAYVSVSPTTGQDRRDLAAALLDLVDERDAIRAELAEERAKPKAPERGPGWSDHGG